MSSHSFKKRLRSTIRQRRKEAGYLVFWFSAGWNDKEVDFIKRSDGVRIEGKHSEEFMRAVTVQQMHAAFDAQLAIETMGKLERL